jgi:hypothetical protein
MSCVGLSPVRLCSRRWAPLDIRVWGVPCQKAEPLAPTSQIFLAELCVSSGWGPPLPRRQIMDAGHGEGLMIQSLDKTKASPGVPLQAP